MASWRRNRLIPSGRPIHDTSQAACPREFHPAMKLSAFFEEDRLAVDAALDRLLPAETIQPVSIHTAMRYSVFAGGKRMRPILCLETARIFSSDLSPALHPACALEFIHTYSLIHDDLPALDNDDLRRGKPTCHKKFGEALAILAGDGLLRPSEQPRYPRSAAPPSSRKLPAPRAPSTAWWAARWRISKQSARRSMRRCSNTFTARK